MKRILQSLEVKQSEKIAIENGLSEDILIENASAHLAKAVRQYILPTYKIGKKEHKTKVVALCGGGNNGADAASAARMLHLCGYDVTIICATKKHNDYVDKRLKAAAYLGIEIQIFSGILPECDIIIDGLIGTGLTSELSSGMTAIVNCVNQSGSYVISVDVPSGINADTGETLGACVKADCTVTFSCYKDGHFLAGAKDYTGKLIIGDIGIKPIENGDNFDFKAYKLEERVVGEDLCVLPNKIMPATLNEVLSQTARGDENVEENDIFRTKRKSNSHKYNYGRVSIIGGSLNMIGAPHLGTNAAKAALRSGAGLVTTCVPDCLQNMIYSGDLNETMYMFLKSDGGVMDFDEKSLNEIMQKSDAIAIGMGMGLSMHLPKIVSHICQNYGGTLVLDADAIGAVATNPNIISDAKCRVVLTPHAGEFKRLAVGLGFNDEVSFKLINDVSAKLNACMLFKSNINIICHNNVVLVNDMGSAALAKGGSGDTLAGIVAALCATKQPLNSCVDDDFLSAVAFASMLHFECAAEAEKLFGQERVLASDIAQLIETKTSPKNK